MRFFLPELFLPIFPNLVSALLNVTSIAIAPGTCQGFPGYVPQPIGDLTQQFFFEARETSNSSLDGLRLSLSITSPSNTSELVINTDPTAAYDIFSCSNGTVFDIDGGPAIVFSAKQQDQELGYPNDDGRERALNPEVFQHDIGGIEQDGLFLGLGNVTTWAFDLQQGGVNGDWYRMRLLDLGTSLGRRESNGFVRIVAL